MTAAKAIQPGKQLAAASKLYWVLEEALKYVVIQELRIRYL